MTMALRFICSVFLLVATLALISELTRAQLGIPGAPFTPLMNQLADSAPATLAALQRSARNVHGLLWDPVLVSVLSLPAWLGFGAIGLVAGWFGRRRRRTAVFTN